MTDQSLTTPIDTSYIEIAIRTWLEAKTRLSGSAKTRKAYSDTLIRFQGLLRQTGRELDPYLNARDKTPEGLRKAISEITLAAQGFAGMSVKNKIVASSTYNQRLAILNSFYQFANDRGFFTSGNPVAAIRPARVQSYKYAQPLDAAMVKERMAAIDRGSKQGARDYALLAIALSTGRRLSEIADLRWKHVQIRKDRVILHFDCKGGVVMRDTLSASVSSALLEWLKMAYGDLRSLPGSMPLWISFTRRAAKESNVSLPALTIRSLANICEARLGTSQFHATRHTFAYTMEEAGVKTSDIQAKLGHKSLQTTGIYLQALRRDDSTHADKLSDIFGLS